MPTILASAHEWVAPYFTDPALALSTITRQIDNAAADYTDRGIAAVDLQPGNGTRYVMVFTALDRLSRERGRDESGWYDAVDAPTAFGGDLLVSMPDFHRATILSSGGIHMPYYIDEKMSLGAPHSAVVAAFLTLFDDALTP